MRKLIHAAVLAAAIAVPLTAATAPAMAGNSTQVPVQTPMDQGPAPACLDPGAELWFAVDNGHLHLVQNANGDWANSTVEGSFFTIEPDGSTLWSGHGMIWFGDESNNQTQVVHFSGNGQLTNASTGQKIKISATGQMVLNANGVLVVNRNVGPGGAPLEIFCK